MFVRILTFLCFFFNNDLLIASCIAHFIGLAVISHCYGDYDFSGQKLALALSLKKNLAAIFFWQYYANI